jgi:hypothetical protein
MKHIPRATRMERKACIVLLAFVAWVVIEILTGKL